MNLFIFEYKIHKFGKYNSLNNVCYSLLNIKLRTYQDVTCNLINQQQNMAHHVNAESNAKLLMCAKRKNLNRHLIITRKIFYFLLLYMPRQQMRTNNLLVAFPINILDISSTIILYHFTFHMNKKNTFTSDKI